MWKLVLLIVFFEFCFLPIHAQIGCRTGDYIYTVQNGTYMNGTSTIPKFTALDRITKRNYDADPNCGINRNTADGYSKVGATSQNPNSECTSDNNIGDIGQLIVYNNADNTCQVPLDGYVWCLFLGCGIFGYLMIQNKRNSLR